MTTKIETAYHEAGHAVVNHLLGIKNKKVSIIPKGDSLGRVESEIYFNEDEDPNANNYPVFNKLENTILSLLAGIAAQKVENPETKFEPSESDYHDAIDMIRYFSDSNKDILPYLEWKIEMIVNCIDVQATIQKLANELIEKKELSGKDADALIKNTLEFMRKPESELRA